MLLKRFYDTRIAQASYLIGCEATGEALVVDPTRDVAQYVRAADAESLRIAHVAETHVHADFVSGTRELAHRCGATMYLSATGGDTWAYGFPTAEDDAAGVSAVAVGDGSSFMVGRVKVDVVATPGHTPEHVVFLLTDTASADKPMGALTGDFVFVGDVGRPDLLERAVGQSGTMEEGARSLFRSLRSFAERPDYLQLWPGHGAGSACGKALGAMAQTTLGYEKLFNPGFTTTDEESFVRLILAGQPDPPTYFAQMKRINNEGPPVLGAVRRPTQCPSSRIAELIDYGALVVDTRPGTDYAARHVPGTLNIPLNGSFVAWAGWLLPYDRDFYVLTVGGDERLDDALHGLSLIGLDRVAGCFTGDALNAWVAGGRELAGVPQLAVGELAPKLAAGAAARGDLAVLDVRGRAEWDAGHLPGATNIPLGQLGKHLAELPTDRPLVVHCQGGNRSAIAASLLRAHGFGNVVNVPGGFGAWERGGHPVERSTDTASPRQG